MIVVDSDVWIHYLRDPGSAVGSELQALIDANRVAMVGVALAEVLQGARGQAEYAELMPRLGRVPYLETTKETWLAAGAMALELRQRGRAVPLTDLIVAALALEGDHQVFTLDEHFQRIPGLRLHEPGSDVAS